MSVPLLMLLRQKFYIRRCTDITAEKRKRSDYAKMLKQYPDVLRIEQMCEALGGMSTKTGYKMLKDGKIGSVKVGREYRITKVDIIDYLMKAN